MVKKILVLGSGLVARPLIHYLLEKTPHEVICAGIDIGRVRELIEGLPRGSAEKLNVNDKSALELLVAKCDLVVSLVPYTFHPLIAGICIRHRKNMITASYVSDAMKALNNDAQKAGILILNEIGLDPGIDHMSAMRVIHGVEKRAGRVISFKSYCGGFPAPDANDNPLGYKFSWSPRGVLLAGRNAAKYLENGRIIEIPGPELFKNHWLMNVPEAGEFEAYPNRDSLPYTEFYGLRHAETMFRGTLRRPGWCDFWYNMARTGWLNDSSRNDLKGKSWARIFRMLVPGTGNLRDELCRFWNVESSSHEIKCLDWLGLLSDETPAHHADNLLDLLCGHLVGKLAYKQGERDMIVLHHEFVAEFSQAREKITSTLIDYGQSNGDSSMSRTVSLPAAIAAKHILEGTFKKLKGIQIPVIPEIYGPILAELGELGIKFVERFVKTA